LKAYAKHVFGVEWDYHHNLGMINRTSFLLNYLSDVLDGAKSYSEWTNGDLYERTTEKFGICEFPGKHLSKTYHEHQNILRQTTESLRIKLAMEPYTESAVQTFKLNHNDNWLRKHQGLALPSLPPTTPEARKYFFTKIREFSEVATADKKKKSQL
jgi:hypothetical protein